MLLSHSLSSINDILIKIPCLNAIINVNIERLLTAGCFSPLGLNRCQSLFHTCIYEGEECVNNVDATFRCICRKGYADKNRECRRIGLSHFPRVDTLKYKGSADVAQW